LEEVGLSELTQDQVEEVCEAAEKAARDYILSKVPLRRISSFDITVEAEGVKPLTVTVDVEIELSPLMRNCDAQKLVDEATKEAFKSVEEYLRKVKCKSKG